MKTIKRIVLFIILISLEFIFILGVFFSNGIDRFSAAKAFSDWKNNPTVKTKIEWEKERSRLQRDNLIIDTIFMSLLIVNTIVSVIFIKKMWKGVGVQRLQPPKPPLTP